MSVSSPSASSRSAFWMGAVVASTVLAGPLVLPMPAHAQLVVSPGQNTGRAPQPSSPVFSQSRVFVPGSQRPASPPSFPQPRAYPPPQPISPQMFPGGATVLGPSPYGTNGNVYGSGSMMGATPGYPYQSQPSVTPPGVFYRRFGGATTAPVGSHEYPNPQIEPPRVVMGRRNPPGSGRFYGNAPMAGSPITGSVHIYTSGGPRTLPSQQYNNYLYAPATIVGGPSLLGGYYYGNYCDTYYADTPCYPSVYSFYPGFPEYIVNPGVIVLSAPYYPAYETPYLPFSAPTYQVTYNQTNYYVAAPERVTQIQDGGPAAPRTLENAYPEGSFQAAFGDIERAWRNGDINLIRKHIRDSDTKLSVYFQGKYSYSIGSGDFAQITRDAFDRLSTVSFQFTRLRKAKNGDVTAYGKHVYRVGSSETSGDAATADNTVPFSTDGSQPAGSQPYDRAGDPAAGQQKTIYTSYTLRKHDDQWDIIGVDSSPTELVK